MADKIRWGILSTAKIGRTRVIPAMQASNNGEVVAVASRNLDSAQAFAADLGIPQAFGSYEAMIDSGEVDAIYNPLPNSMHAEWSIKCAEAGVPTLCEKPLASNAEEAQTIVDAFEERGVLFAEAFMWRFHPQSVYVKQMLHDGAIGDLNVINSTFTFRISSEENIRLSKELAGGGLMDVGCYCISAMRFFTDEEPDGGQAVGRFGERSQVDESLAAVLTFPSGVIGHFDCGLRTQVTHTYELRGTNGRIVVPQAFTMRPDAPTVIQYWHTDYVDGGYDDSYEEIEIDPANSYTLMAEDFADALLNNRPPRFAPQDAVNNMMVIDNLLAAASSEENYWA